MATRTTVYTQDGRIVGHVAGDTYHTTRRRSIHQLRRPPAWAIDRTILYDLTQAGVARVVLTDAEEGKTYTASVSDFWRHGIAINRGHGAQIALPLAYWRVDGRASQFEAQAEREAAKQLSIWELAR